MTLRFREDRPFEYGGTPRPSPEMIASFDFTPWLAWIYAAGLDEAYRLEVFDAVPSLQKAPKSPTA